MGVIQIAGERGNMIHHFLILLTRVSAVVSLLIKKPTKPDLVALKNTHTDIKNLFI